MVIFDSYVKLPEGNQCNTEKNTLQKIASVARKISILNEPCRHTNESQDPSGLVGHFFGLDIVDTVDAVDAQSDRS